MTTNFRLPGPTPLPPAVLAAMQREMIHHRGPDFKALYAEVLRLARRVHRTEGEVFTWPASGSAGWEVAIVNLISPGAAVLAAVCGDFGDRFARVGVAFGLDVRRLDVPWGQAVTPADLRAALEMQPDVTAVFLTHNETSTGVTNPLPELAAIVRDHGALVIVDAVSSAGALPLETDGWGLDFVLSGSQKAWMCPPGLLIAAVGERAWAAHERARFPRFFWDLTAARTSAAAGMTPTTPPLTMLYAYHAALELILDEGIEAVWARHHALGELTRATLDRLGLELFADRAYASDTLTAFRPPAGVAVRDMLETLRREHRVEMQKGQGPIADEILRIGHMGWAHEPAIRDALAAIDATVRTLAPARRAGAVPAAAGS
jgi:aspartate aminotransferase-like enzyme